MKNLMHKLEVDLICGAEARTQWDMIHRDQKLSSLLDLREGSKCVVGYNQHERFTPRQEGGTFMAATDQIGSQITEIGSDTTGLGRWCWVKFQGRNLNTRVVTAYQPCKPNKLASSATYAQQKRYWMLHGCSQCPRKLFRENLIQLLTEWKENGDRIILLMDANEDMKSGQLASLLSAPSLNMIDVIKNKAGQDGPHTWIRGKRQIDGVWATRDVRTERACFLPFFFCIGDHRGILIDVYQSSIVGDKILQIERPYARRLRCNKKENVTKYNDCLAIYCKRHKVLEKLFSLLPAMPLVPDTLKEEMNKIDKVLGDGMKFAEKKCRKLKMGEVPYSPLVAASGHAHSVWSLVVRSHSGQNINSRLIRREALACGLGNVLSTTPEEARRKKRTAAIEYNLLKGKADTLREEFLREIEDKEEREGKRKEIECIRKREQSVQTWRVIAKGIGKRRLQSVKEVEVCQNGIWQKLGTKIEVEEAIMENNSRRFHLTRNTPLMAPYLSRKIGFLANTPYAESIIQGNFTQNDRLSSETNEMLELIGNRPTQPTITASITKNDFQAYWKRAREKTSSSFSGRHFGHYKAASTNDYISEVHACFVHIASETGIKIDRWTKGLTIMLEKSPGVIKVDKLRAILLMEADFNATNKLIFGSRMIKNIEDRQGFPDELYGSRKNCSAIEVAINRRLTIDIIKQKRRPGVIAGVDAAQCYDRIVHSFVMLLCRKEGIPSSPLLMMFGVIQCMTYYLRTAFGDSSTTYGGSQDIPFQGSCQGNGASPALWLLVSLYLVMYMKAKGHNSKFQTAYTRSVLSIIGFIFVDDTDLIILGDQNDSTQIVVNKAQKAIDCWNAALNVSGGTLRPEKCYWYLLDFIWKKGVCSLINRDMYSITVTDEHGTRSQIEQKDHSCAMEALGVWQNLLGDNKQQTKELISIARQANAALGEMPIPRHLCWQALRQSVWKKIEYVLPAVPLTEKQGNDIAKELYTPLLPRLGCNRNFPNRLRYNSPHHLGFGLHHPSHQAAFFRIEIMLMHGGVSTITGKLIATSYEQHKLEVGTYTPLFHLNFKEYGFLTTSTWLSSTWEFCSINKINLHWKGEQSIGPAREEDTPIMEALRSEGITSETYLIPINRVRCYFQIFSISDIATGDGQYIRKVFLQDNVRVSDSKWEWHREKPADSDFKLWRTALPRLLSPTGRLKKPVGLWLCPPHHPVKWHYHNLTDALYEKRANHWVRYTRNASATRTAQIFTALEVLDSKPIHTEYATISRREDRSIIFEGSMPFCAGSIGSIIRQEPWDWTLLQNSNLLDITNLETFAIALRNDKCMAVCDGSFNPTLDSHLVSAGWVIEIGDTRQKVQGWAATKGISADPYRGELLGIYTIMLAIKYIEFNTDMEMQGTIDIYCDNEKAVYMSGTGKGKVNAHRKHMDLLKSIRRIKVLLKTNMRLHHVYGHQDDLRIDTRSLPRQAQLNIEMDQLAKYGLSTAYEHNSAHINFVFPTEAWTVSIGGVKLHDGFQYHLKNWIGQDRLRDYLFDKNILAWNVFPLITFTPLEKHLSRQSMAFNVWFTKHWTNFCAIGRKMVQMKKWSIDLCPCCLKVSETTTLHLYLCDHPPLLTMREYLFNNILTWLDTVDTDPEILRMIVDFWHGRNHQIDNEASPSYLIIYNVLKEMGVQLMWQGLLPLQMVNLQQEFYRTIGSRMTGEKWGEKLVGRMLTATHALWQHRNEIVHRRSVEGLIAEDSIAMRTEVERLYEEYETLEEHIPYLFDASIDELYEKGVAFIRGWIADVNIAMGRYPEAVKATAWDQRENNRQRMHLGMREEQQLLDWRNVLLRT